MTSRASPTPTCYLKALLIILLKVGNLGLLFFLLFFIFAALGVEMFGRLGEYIYWILNFSHEIIFF
jgi:hypothetical protein